MPKLSAARLRRVERALKRGPEALGYSTGLWTAGRVRELIEQPVQGALPRGPRLAHPAPAWVELPAPQRAGAGARRGSHRALETTALREQRTMVFVDESGLRERPHRVRTWAPREQTPVPQYHFNWKVLSPDGGITGWNFYFRLLPRHHPCSASGGLPRPFAAPAAG